MFFGKIGKYKKIDLRFHLWGYLPKDRLFIGTMLALPIKKMKILS